MSRHTRKEAAATGVYYCYAATACSQVCAVPFSSATKNRATVGPTKNGGKKELASQVLLIRFVWIPVA